MARESRTFNAPPDEGCPTAAGWMAFWSDPPTTLADERLADYLATEVDWTEPLDLTEGLCLHCQQQMFRIRELMGKLQGRPPTLPTESGRDG
jgi:hypothetical protein